jgi:hypothetical protein
MTVDQEQSDPKSTFASECVAGCHCEPSVRVETESLHPDFGTPIALANANLASASASASATLLVSAVSTARHAYSVPVPSVAN